MSLKGKNGADAGREYADKFQAYIENGKSTGTLPWSSNGKLNRSKMAQDLKFGRDVFRTNPAIAEILANIEGNPSHQTNVSETNTQASGAKTRREADAIDQVKKLQERLATVEEENRYLKDQMRKKGYADLTLPDIGRMPW